jgi:hypothetical protein
MGELHIQTSRLIAGIYEVPRFDGLRCDDVQIKFNKDWFSHSDVDKGDTQTDRKNGDLISLLLVFFKMRKVGKKL